ncbi:hypothetical protein HAX54_035185 [Datura stramonium]|uniref:Uncharacterized protein n=1 Tax=Datura stramonium TaxID=4076 RepID=A0ABS8VGN9_DATST|nr:hypothetical protein [Datura stramonium]
MEDRMNHLASQVRSEMSVKEKEPLMENITPSPKDVDEEDREQDIEEILFKESLEAILLNNMGKSSERTMSSSRKHNKGKDLMRVDAPQEVDTEET